eukprot:366431-Chlamydomonas_euryale.AAC.15
MQQTSVVLVLANLCGGSGLLSTPGQADWMLFFAMAEVLWQKTIVHSLWKRRTVTGSNSEHGWLAGRGRWAGLRTNVVTVGTHHKKVSPCMCGWLARCMWAG